MVWRRGDRIDHFLFKARVEFEPELKKPLSIRWSLVLVISGAAQCGKDALRQRSFAAAHLSRVVFC
jgi:hypothetical protein